MDSDDIAGFGTLSELDQMATIAVGFESSRFVLLGKK